MTAFDRVCRLARDFECDARTALLKLSMERQGMLISSKMENSADAAGFGSGIITGVAEGSLSATSTTGSSIKY